MTNLPLPVDPQAVVTELQATGYVADEALATSTFLLLHLGRPLLLEGPSGVGKTELAQALKRREALLRLVDPAALGDFRWLLYSRGAGADRISLATHQDNAGSRSG